ncbi:MAG: phosphate acetyltransferase [Propionibacteriaceae bacterium]|jgi:phosphate acetyltransferase|nr:phosphate acetyltransferase [Propionibacteriaceae bacterium]
MANCIYVLAPEALVGKSAIALGALESFIQAGLSVGVFRPITKTGHDTTLETLLEATGSDQPYEQGCGVTYDAVRRDTTGASMTIIEKFATLAAAYDAVVILGSDYSDVITPIEFSLNAQIAANLNVPVLLVKSARGKTPADLRHAAEFNLRELNKHRISPLGVVALGADGAPLDQYESELARLALPLTMVLPGMITSLVELPGSFVSLAHATDTSVRTPLRLQYELMQRARADRRTIVLPESGEDRILASAAIVLERGVANLILLGGASTILARAGELGLDLSAAKIQDPNDPALVETFAAEYARLRAHKEITLDQARVTLTDPSYFATMMIHFGLADGMVSGAINTTANTIRPALEFIKTTPGVKIVSGYFLMCLADRVLVFADCAVNPNPTAEQLADIALASAETARSFNIDPRVALLSYSTGASGTGPDVDLVREATRLAKERGGDLPIEGPIQFDAAIDPVVARTKLPNSPVAGQATVFIFPDLNTGNTTYKAVQRTADAIAIGPILQGLRKPVNDLSRGALIDDIVNTIAITAIQAQAEPGVAS